MITKNELEKIKNDIKNIIENTDNGENIELCGVVVRTKKGIDTRQLKNVAQSTHITDYEMSPQELGEKTHDTTLFRAKAENEFLAVWHTHPHSSSHPSSIDINNCLFERDYIIYSVVDDDILIFKLSKGVDAK
jgi:proteasome lid subunit RPN8/RPN11